MENSIQVSKLSKVELICQLGKVLSHLRHFESAKNTHQANKDITEAEQNPDFLEEQKAFLHLCEELNLDTDLDLAKPSNFDKAFFSKFTADFERQMGKEALDLLNTSALTNYFLSNYDKDRGETVDHVLNNQNHLLYCLANLDVSNLLRHENLIMFDQRREITSDLFRGHLKEVENNLRNLTL